MTAARASRSATSRAWRRLAETAGPRRSRPGRRRGRRDALVDGPADAPGLRPRPPQVLGGLVGVVGHDVDRGALLGPAHLHVGQLPAAAVLQGVGPVHRRPLGAVDGDGVAVGQVVGVELVAGRSAAMRPSSMVAASSRRSTSTASTVPRSEVTISPPAPGRQGDDAVAGPVGRRRRRPAPGPRAGPWRSHASRPRRFSSATLARRQAYMAAVVPLGHVGGPAGHGGVEGRVAVGGDGDAAVAGVPGHGLGDVAGPQLRPGRPARRGRAGARSRSATCTAAPKRRHQGLEAAAGADGAQLAVVAHHHHLGAGRLGRLQEARAGRRRRSWPPRRGRPRGGGEGAAGRGRCARSARPGCGSGRCRPRRPRVGPPGPTWRCRSPRSRRPRRRRAPRPGRWSCPSRPRPPPGRRPGPRCRWPPPPPRWPAVSGWPSDASARAMAAAAASSDTPAASPRPTCASTAAGDGLLPGDGRGGGVGPLAGAGHADQGHGLGVGQDAVHHPRPARRGRGRRGAGPRPRSRRGG